MLRRMFAAAGLVIALLGGTLVGAAPASAHSDGGSCEGSASIGAINRTVISNQTVACDRVHQVWDICVYLWWRTNTPLSAPGSWVLAASDCYYVDLTGTGSTKTSHSMTVSATCDPLNGPFQEWALVSQWQVGAGLYPHPGGNEVHTNVLCV